MHTADKELDKEESKILVSAINSHMLTLSVEDVHHIPVSGCPSRCHQLLVR